jgi:hypothetical protein
MQLKKKRMCTYDGALALESLLLRYSLTVKYDTAAKARRTPAILREVGTSIPMTIANTSVKRGWDGCHTEASIAEDSLRPTM